MKSGLIKEEKVYFKVWNSPEFILSVYSNTEKQYRLELDNWDADNNAFIYMTKEELVKVSEAINRVLA